MKDDKKTYTSTKNDIKDLKPTLYLLHNGTRATYELNTIVTFY